MFTEPVRGLEEGGFRGLLQGARRGALGLVVLPVVAVLEMSARLADSVRRAVAGSNNVGWARPPRYVSSQKALEAYAWSDAMGRWLLTELQKMEGHDEDEQGRARETFVLCVPTSMQDCYVVVTSER